MKIAICGKGGCGKSTTVALLAKELAHAGKRVLVIDSDESNYGLYCQLGMELPKDFTAFFGGKEAVLKDMMLSNFAHKFFDGPWSFTDIPEGCCGVKDGVMLMASGKIHQANEGCACPMNNNMGDPRASLVVEFHTIVDGAEMPVCIPAHDDAGIQLPVLTGFHGSKSNSFASDHQTFLK